MSVKILPEKFGVHLSAHLQNWIKRNPHLMPGSPGIQTAIEFGNTVGQMSLTGQPFIKRADVYGSKERLTIAQRHYLDWTMEDEAPCLHILFAASRSSRLKIEVDLVGSETVQVTVIFFEGGAVVVERVFALFELGTGYKLSIKAEGKLA